jgi:hypothetical protein
MRLRHDNSVPSEPRQTEVPGSGGSQHSKYANHTMQREADNGSDGTGPPRDGYGSNAAVTLHRSGAWLVTTYSGARLLVVVVIDPISRSPIITMTRYAAPDHGDEFNGAPLTITVSEPPEIGERWHGELIATDERFSAHNEIIYGEASARYVSTPVIRIEELSYDMLVAASAP